MINVSINLDEIKNLNLPTHISSEELLQDNIAYLKDFLALEDIPYNLDDILIAIKDQNPKHIEGPWKRKQHKVNMDRKKAIKFIEDQNFQKSMALLQEFSSHDHMQEALNIPLFQASALMLIIIWQLICRYSTPFDIYFFIETNHPNLRILFPNFPSAKYLQFSLTTVRTCSGLFSHKKILNILKLMTKLSLLNLQMKTKKNGNNEITINLDQEETINKINKALSKFYFLNKITINEDDLFYDDPSLTEVLLTNLNENSTLDWFYPLPNNEVATALQQLYTTNPEIFDQNHMGKMGNGQFYMIDLEKCLNLLDRKSKKYLTSKHFKNLKSITIYMNNLNANQVDISQIFLTSLNPKKKNFYQMEEVIMHYFSIQPKLNKINMITVKFNKVYMPYSQETVESDEKIMTTYLKYLREKNLIADPNAPKNIWYYKLNIESKIDNQSEILRNLVSWGLGKF